ncbi:hypothetical protein ACIQPT_23250 [Streptomyces sp. NPDC091289]|uniref:hypothetical protein n=1 Tax=Streptomyces sp. NPDC091289 TaxID=3365989 RepID=UPI003806A77B
MNGTDGDERAGSAGAARVRCRIDIDADGRYAWRMIAQNGRVVAVSAQAFPAYGDCRRAFDELRGNHHGQAGGVQHTPSGSGWIWLLREADGRATAVSARAYERHSTCRAAYQRFRGLLAGIGDVTGSCL